MEISQEQKIKTINSEDPLTIVTVYEQISEKLKLNHYQVVLIISASQILMAVMRLLLHYLKVHSKESFLPIIL